MKKLYERYFYVPKHGKVEDRVMLTRTVTAAAIMILCLAAMSFSAYAYFSHTITAGSNVIKAADFDVSVTVTGEGATDPVEANAEGIYSLTNGTYTVSLERGGTAKTGFCVVTITVGSRSETYHTQQLSVDNAKTSTPLQFTLILSDMPTTASGEPATAAVTFTPHWGTSRFYGQEDADTNPLYIKDKVAFSGAGAGSGSGQETTTTATVTTTTTTTTTTTAATATTTTTATTTAATTTTTTATTTTTTTTAATATTTTTEAPVQTTTTTEMVTTTETSAEVTTETSAEVTTETVTTTTDAGA